MKRLLALAFLVCLSSVAYAQAIPTGGCSQNAPQQTVPDVGIFGCGPNGTWILLAPVGPVYQPGKILVQAVGPVNPCTAVGQRFINTTTQAESYCGTDLAWHTASGGGSGPPFSIPLTAPQINGEFTVDGTVYTTLNAAFTAAAAITTGATINLGPGNWGITSQLTQPEQAVGVGINCTASTNCFITAMATMNAMMFKGDTVQGNFTLRGVTFLCNSGSTINAQYGLQLQWFRGGLLDDVQVQNCGTEDITTGNPTANHQTSLNARVIQTNYNENVFTGPAGGGGPAPPNQGIHLLNNSYDSIWDNVTVRNAHLEGLKIDATASGNTFRSLHVFGYAATGILPYAPSYAFEDSSGGNQFPDLYCDGNTVSCFHFSMSGTSANDVINGGKFFWPSGTTWPASANFGTMDQQYSDYSVRNFWCSGLQTANIWTVSGAATANLFGNRVMFDNVTGCTQQMNYYLPTINRSFNWSTGTPSNIFTYQGSVAYRNNNNQSGAHQEKYLDRNAAELGFIDDFGGLSFPSASVYGSLTAADLGTPALSAITVNGTAGSTTCTYLAQAYAGDQVAHGLPSSVATTNTCNATQTSSNSNSFTWAAIPGAWSYKIYRTAGGADQGWLSTAGASSNGFVNTNSFTDTGFAGDSSTAPNTDTTGNVHIVNLKSATGARFLCIDSTGKLVSQAAACTGT